MVLQIQAVYALTPTSDVVFVVNNQATHNFDFEATTF